MIETTWPASRRALASCQTRRSKGLGRFSTRMSTRSRAAPGGGFRSTASFPADEVHRREEEPAEPRARERGGVPGIDAKVVAQGDLGGFAEYAAQQLLELCRREARVRAQVVAEAPAGPRPPVDHVPLDHLAPRGVLAAQVADPAAPVGRADAVGAVPGQGPAQSGMCSSTWNE